MIDFCCVNKNWMFYSRTACLTTSQQSLSNCHTCIKMWSLKVLSASFQYTSICTLCVCVCVSVCMHLCICMYIRTQKWSFTQVPQNWPVCDSLAHLSILPMPLCLHQKQNMKTVYLSIICYLVIILVLIFVIISGVYRFIVLFFTCLMTFGSYFCFDMPSVLQAQFQAVSIYQ